MINFEEERGNKCWYQKYEEPMQGFQGISNLLLDLIGSHWSVFIL